MLRLPLLAALLLASSLRASDHWPSWRGPTGMGHYDANDLPLQWNAKTGQNVLWKMPLFPSDKVRRDQNQSSPIVWGERVFVTVSYWPEGTSEKEFPEHHVLCFRTTDGAKLWDTPVPPGPWKLTDLRGGYTAPTPACDGQRIYVAFGSAILAALDMDGKLLWRHELKPHFFDVALGTSPIVFKDTVIMVCDLIKDHKASRIQALDAKTGQIRWEKKRPAVDWAHSTPILAQVNDQPQLLLATANGPQGLDPVTGDLLWWHTAEGRVGDTVSPVYRDGQLYMDSGRGGSGLALKIGRGELGKDQLAWTQKSLPEGFSSPVLIGPQLYRLHAPEVLSCWKWSDGATVFKERLAGLDHAISPLATADGKLYLAAAGKSYVLQAGPKLEILAENDLGDPSRASPAAARGRIYLKGARYLWGVGKK